MVVKDNLLVIRMDVAGLTQWGSSWPRERVCGRVGFERIVEKCGKGKSLPFALREGGSRELLTSFQKLMFSVRPREMCKARPSGSILGTSWGREMGSSDGLN